MLDLLTNSAFGRLVCLMRAGLQHTKTCFDLTDEDCAAGLAEHEANKEEKKAKVKDDWVGKLWTIITASLHDDIYTKINHVKRGAIKSLMTEINAALVMNNAEESQPLRLELYAERLRFRPSVVDFVSASTGKETGISRETSRG